jgi:hypothetical protein
MNKIILGGYNNRNQGAHLHKPQPQPDDILNCGQVTHHYGGGGGLLTAALDIATGGATSILCVVGDAACVICAVDTVACVLCDACSISSLACEAGCVSCYAGCTSCGCSPVCTSGCYTEPSACGCMPSSQCCTCVSTSGCGFDCGCNPYNPGTCVGNPGTCIGQPCGVCMACACTPMCTPTTCIEGPACGCLPCTCGVCCCDKGYGPGQQCVTQPSTSCISGPCAQTGCDVCQPICCDKGYNPGQTCITQPGTTCLPQGCIPSLCTPSVCTTNFCTPTFCDGGLACNVCSPFCCAPCFCCTCASCIPTCTSENCIICCNEICASDCVSCDSCLPCGCTPSCEAPCSSECAPEGCCTCECVSCCTDCCASCCDTCCTDCCTACCDTCCCDTCCCMDCCTSCCDMCGCDTCYCDTCCCNTCCCDMCCCDMCCCDTCCCEECCQDCCDCCCEDKCKTKKPKAKSPTGKKPAHKPTKKPAQSLGKGLNGPSALCGVANLLKAGGAKKALELAKLGTGNIGENIGGLSNAGAKGAACQIRPCKGLGYGCLAEGGLFHAAGGGKAGKIANLAKLTTNQIGDSSNLLGTVNQRTMACQISPCKGLGYGCLASGGQVHHFACGGSGSDENCICKKIQAIKDATAAATKSRSDPFDISKYEPKMVCSQPEILINRGSGQHFSNTPLSHIYQGIIGHADGGGLPSRYKAAAPHGHNPEFVTGMTGYYACGGGTGQSDDIPAMLHDGDYVMDAESVSALGDGSSKAGKQVLDGFRERVPHIDHLAEGGSASGNPVPAKIADGEYVFPAAFVTALGQGDNRKGAEILDGLREKLRQHKRSAPLDKIPPKAKSPLDYIKKGTK